MILPSVLEGPVPEHVTGQEFLQHLEATEMEEKVDGSGQDETIYRHVSSKCQTVTSEGFVPSGQGIVPEATFIPSNLRPLIFSKPNEGFRMGNYSLQTGEEFAVEFVKEASRFAMNNSQGRSGLAQLPVCKGDFYETNPYVYEDLTGILGIERMASGSNSDISMLTGKRANLSGFGSDCDPSYTESAEETQIFRSVNEGEFEFDKRLVASSCQAEFQHMPYYSTHQPYLSGPSDDSSSGKVKFMCSFGGKILPRPSDGKLRYVGGETRIITMNKDIGYEELMQKMKDNYGQALMLKYQLPDEDLDALVSVSSDEDLENMMEEYDRLRGGEGSSRLRVFLFTAVDIALTHFDSMTDRRKCEQRYVDAVNGIPETDSQRHADSTATAPSQYLENLIGLDDAENQNTTSETQEAVPTPLLLPQLSHDVAKVVHPPGIPPFSSKHTISTAASGTKSTASSPPLFPLPIHFKQPRIVDTPLHTLPDHLLQGDGHSSSSDCPVEFYHDLEYGGPISSSAASSQNEVHYKFRESRRAPDSPIKAQQDLLPLSYSDSMYHGELGFTDPLLPRVESHGKLNWLQEQFEDAQPMLNLRSDGELRPVDLHRIALQRVPPPVHQPTWKHNLDADQYGYQQTDYIQQTKSSGQPVQQQSMQTTHHNISQLPSHDAAVFRHIDQAQLHQDDAYGGPYMHKSVSTDQPGYSATAAAILQQAGLSPPSPPQVGKGQWHLQGHRPPNAPFVDQHHYRARVQHFNDEPSRAFYPATSPCNNEQLPEQVAYQQTFLHEQLSHPEEWFAHQQAIPFEQVCHQQALPHVHSDTVLQTHAMKPVNSMYEGIPLSQGHHSDGSLRARASYIGPSTSQEGLMPFQDCQEIGDVSNQVGQQGSQSEQIFSGQPVYTVPHVSSGSEEQPSVHTHFHESSDEIDSVLQQKTLKRDENKMHFVIGTRMDQSEVNNEEQSSELSRSNHSNPAVSYGGLDFSEDSNTFLFPGSGDSYQASEKIEKVEPFGAISYQLKLPTAAGQTGAMGILSNALRSSELTGRISQVAAAWSESNAQELRTGYPPKEHVLGHCASNINSQLLTMDQMVIGDSLVEMGLNPHLSMAGAEPSIPSSNSEIWWGGMGLERDHDKVEASMYSLGQARNSAEGLPQNTLNLIVSNETSRPVDSDRTIPLDEGSKILTSTPEHHCAQLLGESLIDDGDVEHSAYLLSDTLSNTRLVDELSCSSYVTMPVNMEEEGKYQKSDLLNCDVIKGLFPRPLTSVDDKAGNGHIDESSGKDISAHMKNRGVDSIQAICQDQSDEEVKGKSKVGENNAAAAVLRPNILPASTLSMSEWDQVTEDVRIEQNFCDRVTEVVDEETITAQDSDFEEAKIDDSDKDEPVSDAAIAECEAIAHGLQIIKNADLEELRELGSGTFGTVYHGKWRGSDVAIKRIKNSCFMGRPSEQERLRADFWREAWMLAHLHHPNVVAFYGVVPDGPGGTLATVTEYMVNGSLKQVLQRKDRSIDRRKRLLITMDAAFGMEYLHGKNIVHFDLKCENLLVNMRDPQRPICKVGDLGLSKIKHQTLVSGGVRGTLPWMAPELLNGSSSMVSEKVDVFSFGIVMWELLTGDEPYANMHYGAIIGGIVNNTLRPPIPNWCDPAWRLLMEQCWAADPAARPSFTEVANQLRAMATSLPLKGHSHQAQVHAHN